MRYPICPIRRDRRHAHQGAVVCLALVRQQSRGGKRAAGRDRGRS